jgi:hypothetical protein
MRSELPGTGEGFAVALCVLAICILSTVATAHMAPFTGKGPPGTYVAPVAYAPAPQIAKDESRIEPGPLVPFVPRPKPKAESVKPKRTATLQTETIRLPWPCSDVRKVVEQVGREVAEAVAKQQGLTKKQIVEARNCLKERK